MEGEEPQVKIKLVKPIMLGTRHVSEGKTIEVPEALAQSYREQGAAELAPEDAPVDDPEAPDKKKPGRPPGGSLVNPQS